MSARILLVEQDPGLSRLISEQLRPHGHLVNARETGVDLPVLAKGHDLILLHAGHPEHQGLELLPTGSGSPPWIVITPPGKEQVAVEAMKRGAFDYLVKDDAGNWLELLPIIVQKAIVNLRLADERESLQISVEKSEERYHRLIELSPDGIAVCIEGRIDFINPAGLLLLGARSREELRGCTFDHFVHPENRAIFLDLVSRMLSRGNETPWTEGRLLRMDGCSMFVEMAGIPLSHEGKPAIQVLFRDTTDQRLARKRLEELTHFDMLTGLPNRTLFFDRLKQSVLNAHRYGHRCALMLLDIDSFKGINESLGHQSGDHILKEIGKRLKGVLRQSDTVARVGGDEFSVILSQTGSAEETARVADKLLATVSSPLPLGGATYQLSATMGISLYSPDGDSGQNLLRAADDAMYKAKRHRRGTYRFSHEETVSTPAT